MVFYPNKYLYHLLYINFLSAMSLTLYDLLKITPSASQEEVRWASRAPARELHPNLPTSSAEQMRNVIDAYVTLSNPTRHAA